MPWRRSDTHGLRRRHGIALAGAALGTALGLFLDARSVGLYTLVSLCGSLPPLSPASALIKLQLAPWTYALGWIGGVGGVLGAEPRRRSIPAKSLAAALTGMTVGMAAGDAAASALIGYFAPGPALGAAVMGMLMLAGMAVGMNLVGPAGIRTAVSPRLRGPAGRSWKTR